MTVKINKDTCVGSVAILGFYLVSTMIIENCKTKCDEDTCIDAEFVFRPACAGNFLKSIGRSGNRPVLFTAKFLKG